MPPQTITADRFLELSEAFRGSKVLLSAVELRKIRFRNDNGDCLHQYPFCCGGPIETTQAY